MELASLAPRERETLCWRYRYHPPPHVVKRPFLQLCPRAVFQKPIVERSVSFYRDQHLLSHLRPCFDNHPKIFQIRPPLRRCVPSRYLPFPSLLPAPRRAGKQESLESFPASQSIASPTRGPPTPSLRPNVVHIYLCMVFICVPTPLPCRLLTREKVPSAPSTSTGRVPRCDPRGL